MDTEINNSDSFSAGESFTARLRRLKIQESIFISNVKNSLLKYPDYKDNNERGNELMFKKMCTHLKNSFIEIKNLFEDVKIKTNFQESLDKIDIDDLKKDVTQLEFKMKSLKHHIQNELRRLQFEENMIKEKVNTNSLTKDKKYKTCGSICSKQYTEIVTSPVRAIINSPFKCWEVQEFQEFMKRSQNKCGGWNEYNHNAFTHIWRKYFNGVLVNPSHIEDSLLFEDFKNEVLLKIPDSKPDEILSHGKWYAEYLHLHHGQEVAINRWKENRKKIKQSLREKNKSEASVLSDSENLRTRENILNKGKSKPLSSPDDELSLSLQAESRKQCMQVCKATKLHFLKPTKQWICRRNSSKETPQWNFDVDNINKLGKPTWRLSMETKK